MPNQPVRNLMACYKSFMVTLGWALNKPLLLLFDPFESVVSYNHLVQSITGLSPLSGTLHLRQVIFVVWKLVLRSHLSTNNELRRRRRQV